MKLNLRKTFLLTVSLIMIAFIPAKADELYICQNCPAGTWSDGMFTTCKSCLTTGVATCSSTTGMPTSCKAGYGFDADYEEENCEYICSYEDNGETSCEEICNYSEILSSSCNKCPIGKYSKGGKVSCSSCAKGTYTSTTGASSCSTCPAGYSCPGGTDKKICPAGQYSSAGASSCSTCPKGYYCPGGTDKKVCPAGSYCPNTGMSAPTSCSNMGSKYYQPKKGQTTCSYCENETKDSEYVCGETCSDCNCKDVCTGYSDVCRDENGETDGDDGSVSCNLECDGYEEECDECCSDDYCDCTITKHYKVNSARTACVYDYTDDDCS